jgi:hypothetical protein
LKGSFLNPKTEFYEKNPKIEGNRIISFFMYVGQVVLPMMMCGRNALSLYLCRVYLKEFTHELSTLWIAEYFSLHILGKTAESWHIKGSMLECLYFLNQSMK